MRLFSFFLQVVILAKLYTKEQNKNTAINKFKKVLQNRDQWFNSQPFPSSESGEDAFVKCHDTASAQVHCPERWKALQSWIKNTNRVRKATVYCLTKKFSFLYACENFVKMILKDRVFSLTFIVKGPVEDDI